MYLHTIVQRANLQEEMILKYSLHWYS